MHAVGCSTAVILLACGGTTITSGDRDGGALRTCSIPAGTYTQTLMAEAGQPHCPIIAAQTIMIPETEAITGNEMGTGGGGFGLFDGGSDCTTGADSSTCTFTTTCTTTTNGTTSQMSISLTFDGDSATGNEATESTDSMGKVLSSCNYDITITRG
jgi:hypothetical protein